MDYGLLIATQDVPQSVRLFELGLEQRLANTSDVAMAKDAQAAGEELLLLAVGFGVLDPEELHQRLRHGEPGCSCGGARGRRLPRRRQSRHAQASWTVCERSLGSTD